MQSLFIVSLPRAFSTKTYHLARRALSLAQPSWVLDGEILNVDRYCHYVGIRFDESAKFTLPKRDPRLVSQLHDFLNQVTVAEGYIYKDVTQPFVLAQWEGLKNFRVLKIQRSVEEVAAAMLANGWFYPQYAASHVIPLPRLLQWARRVTPFQYSAKLHRLFRARFENGVIEGLVRAERVLDSIEGHVVQYHAIIQDEACLRDALTALYPHERVALIRFMNAAFANKRERLAHRRQTRAYQRLAQKVERVRNSIAQNQV